MTPTLDDWLRPTRTPCLVKPYPWMHPASVCYLETLLRPDWTVLEHGSGGSTLWFAERVAKVYSVEDRPEWAIYIRQHNERGNITIWDSRDGERIPFELGRCVNLILIDGHPAASRPLWIRKSPRLLLPGGVLVLDNANAGYVIPPRYDLEKLCAHAVTIHPHGGGKAIDTTFYFMPREP
jgi:predicted O-methyltransferase YrrM